jgi:hypothetical protein
MKLKIREIFNTIIPKYNYFGNKNIFSIKITDQFKYLTLPVRISSPSINRVNLN